MNKKKIFLLLLLLVIFVTGGYYLAKELAPPKIQPEPTLDTTDWKIYENQRFHYRVKYPPSLALDALPEGDNPFTESIEIGDEGTFIVDPQIQEDQLQRSMSVSATYLTDVNESLSLEDFIQTQGSYINFCHEDKPEKTEEVTTISGQKGIKVWYWIKAGCEGAEERMLNDPYVFFDAREHDSEVLIEFFQAQMDEEFDDIVSTFEFIEPLNYGD